MYWITESMFSFSYLSGAPNTKGLWDVLRTHLVLVHPLKPSEATLSLSYQFFRHLERFLTPDLVVVLVPDLSESSSSLNRTLAATLLSEDPAVCLPQPFFLVCLCLQLVMLILTRCGSALFRVAVTIHHVVLELSLLCPGSPITVMFTLSSGFTQVLVENVVDCSLFSSVHHVLHDCAFRAVSAPWRRCLRVRQSRSASAELTPVQCEASVSPRSWLSRRAARPFTCWRTCFHPHAPFRCCAWSAGNQRGLQLVHVLRVVRRLSPKQVPTLSTLRAPHVECSTSELGCSDSLLHVAILSGPLFAEGLCEDAIVTPGLGCSGSRIHAVIRPS